MIALNAHLDAVLAVLSLVGAAIEYRLHRRGLLRRTWWPVLLALAVIFALFTAFASQGASGERQTAAMVIRTATL